MFALSALAADTPTAPIGYLVTNDDKGPGSPNTSTFFTIAADGALSNPTLVTLSGEGVAGGYFTANRVNTANKVNSSCVYLSEGSTNTITGVQASTQTVVGDFHGSANDIGADNGIGMVMDPNYLYASFSASGTIATFAVQPGCELEFLSDVAPSGLNGGAPKGMALYGNLLVVAYGDGSIESFDVSNGAPITNGDEQNSTGFSSDDFPDGVVISPDGNWAIFGDDSSGASVEVSNISSGQLMPTVLYSLPAGLNSNNVLLSPDGTILYIVNNTSGQISAAFFDTAAGTVSYGCTSPSLRGFNSAFTFLSEPVLQTLPDAASVLYVAEDGQPSAIGIVRAKSIGGTCKLWEAAGSPVADNNSLSLLSIGAVSTLPIGVYKPVAGSTLAGSSVTFHWDGPPGASAFQFEVGSSAGGSQYYQSGSLSASTRSATVTALPTNGSTVYVTLAWLIDGSWVSDSYTYMAHRMK